MISKRKLIMMKMKIITTMLIRMSMSSSIMRLLTKILSMI